MLLSLFWSREIVKNWPEFLAGPKASASFYLMVNLALCATAKVLLICSSDSV